MSDSIIQEFLKTLPPSHVNNAREIVRNLWSKWKSTRSPYLAHKLSKLLKIEPDLKDIHGRYTEYPKTEGAKDYSELKTKLPNNIPF